MSTLLAKLADCQPKERGDLKKFFNWTDQQLDAELDRLVAQGLRIGEQQNWLQLIPHLPLLNIEQLRQNLAPYPIHYQPIIDSTNEFLLQHFEQLPKGALCLTEHQQAGRGRRGRQWQSPFAGQIILSFTWQVPQSRGLNGLSCVIALGVMHAFLELGLYGFQVKWPNDILINERKLAGILVEIVNNKNGQFNLVVGIGMNVSLGVQQNINQPWAEMHEFYSDVSREELIEQMVKSIYQYLQQFEQHGINAEWQQQWLEHDAFWSMPVNLIGERETISGIAQGIDENGYLQLKTEQGIVKFNAGEVSLRKA